MVVPIARTAPCDDAAHFAGAAHFITAAIEPQRPLLRLTPGKLRTDHFIMKIVLFALLGLMLGTLGGAALGIGLGLAWIEIFKTTDFEGYSGMLVFFTFM